MAKTIFAVGKNRVVQIPDDVAPGRFTFKLDGWQGYRSLQSIITRVGVSKQCSAQLLHTLGDDTYIYTFGHRVGQITISGWRLPPRVTAVGKRSWAQSTF